eukprot:205973-Prorocentrum_lima.AAC.1
MLPESQRIMTTPRRNDNPGMSIAADSPTAEVMASKMQQMHAPRTMRMQLMPYFGSLSGTNSPR